MLTIPADYTAECNDMHPLDAASATDNCGMVTIDEVADTVFTCPNSYVVTRTFTATDECGNDSTASQTITIQDTTKPMLMIPAITLLSAATITLWMLLLQRTTAAW